MAQNDKNEVIARLWKSDKNKDMLTGVVNMPDGEQIRVVAFINRDKKFDTSPDINIYPARDQEGQGQAPAQNKTYNRGNSGRSNSGGGRKPYNNNRQPQNTAAAAAPEDNGDIVL